ncbi:hypothetical protein WN55_00383 [Dufourea novaeangliae]|uniref:Uncharacterized protein n=1 Tax=Dufourea novaeangliae TaxID=178035 RepID=A0A154PFL3_DUFNO|nr:hypothetical protein WN55_00383 [Dufourea novaeangliae]
MCKLFEWISVLQFFNLQEHKAVTGWDVIWSLEKLEKHCDSVVNSEEEGMIYG